MGAVRSRRAGAPRAVTAVLTVALAAGLAAGCSGPAPGDAGSAPPATSSSPAADPSVPTDDVAPAPQAPVVTELTVVGDIMLDRGVTARTTPAGALRHMARHLRRADITVGNLESTLSERGAPTQGDDSFAASPGVLADLRRVGFDALSLANNHTGDHGPRALVDTVDAFRGSGIAAFGAGRDLRAATRAAVVEHQGLRFGFLGFNAIGETPRAAAGSPGALSVRMPPRTGPLHRGDLRHVTGAVRRLDRRVDVVVVLPHWGAQYTHVPEPVQSSVGRALVDAGADLVAGGHPHWVQPTERHRGAVIAHSLGNFVFDMDFSEPAMEGMTLTATFEDDRLVGVDLTPYRLGEDFAPRIVTGAAAAAILADAGLRRR